MAERTAWDEVTFQDPADQAPVAYANAVLAG